MAIKAEADDTSIDRCEEIKKANMIYVGHFWRLLQFNSRSAVYVFRVTAIRMNTTRKLERSVTHLPLTCNNFTTAEFEAS